MSIRFDVDVNVNSQGKNNEELLRTKKNALSLSLSLLLSQTKRFCSAYHLDIESALPRAIRKESGAFLDRKTTRNPVFCFLLEKPNASPIDAV